MLQYILNLLGSGSHEWIQRGNGIEFKTTHPEVISAIGFCKIKHRDPILHKPRPPL